MPDPGRPPDVSTLTPAELERTRRDLAVALALARPGSPARAPIGTHLAAIDAGLASRTSQREAPDPSPPDGGGHMPGPHISTRMDIEEVRAPLEDIGHREYLIIQPLAPTAPGTLITKAAQAVKILNDLGLIIRLT